MQVGARALSTQHPTTSPPLPLLPFSSPSPGPRPAAPTPAPRAAPLETLPRTLACTCSRAQRSFGSTCWKAWCRIAGAELPVEARVATSEKSTCRPPGAPCPRPALRPSVLAWVLRFGKVHDFDRRGGGGNLWELGGRVGVERVQDQEDPFLESHLLGDLPARPQQPWAVLSRPRPCSDVASAVLSRARPC